MAPLLHLSIAQFKPVKGDYLANIARIGEILAQAAVEQPRPAVVHFPETAPSGYFLEGGVRESAVTAGTLVRDLDGSYRAASRKAEPIDVVIGFYEVWRHTLYNSAMYATLGGSAPTVLHVHRKNFLPTYGLFDEERFVDRGHEIAAFDTSWGRAAMLVCEDAWHSITGAIVALDGAQAMFLCAAAPGRGPWPREDLIPGPASVARWDRLVRDIAEEHGMFVSLANLVGSEGGKMFSGASTLAGPHGDIRARAPVFEESLLLATVDLADLTRSRSDMPLLSDLRTAAPHLRVQLERAERRGPVTLEYDPAASVGSKATGVKASGKSRSVLPIHRSERDTGAGPPSLDIDAPLTERWLVEFIRDEMKRRGFTKGIVGISGGVDSAVTACLAAKALGPEHVIGVRMPYRTSSADSMQHGQLVIDSLGIESRTVDITAAVDGYLAIETDADAARRGNVMARQRMIVLFDLSAKHRAIPLGTGNKSERLLGYFTWHADDSPPVNPLGDLYKTQVWALARHLGIPEAIVGKAPTADLVHGQTDEGDIGVTYGTADSILHWLLSGYGADELVARGFSARDVERVRKRLDGTHWKRRLPTVALLSATAIGESWLRPVDY